MGARDLLQIAHYLRLARAAQAVHKLLSGVIFLWSVKDRLQAVQVSHAKQRVWCAASNALLLSLQSDTGFWRLHTVHLMGHADGKQPWHIRRPSASSRRCWLWNALWQPVHALEEYFSCWWQASHTVEAAEK